MRRTIPPRAPLVGALMLAALAAGCSREEARAPAAPAASAPASAASAAAAPAPSGPVIAPVALAQPTDAQRSEGAVLASQGASGVAACASCHGAQGEGNAQGGFPRLAGQSYSYLVHELQSYAQQSRTHPVMQPIATAMNDAQRAAAAAYYASLAPAAAASAPAGGGTAGGRGRRLAEVGDESRGVQGCVNCHGVGGIGSGELYPYLAGQHASYLTATLGAWRDGTRHNDPSGQMPLIARSLAAEDVKAVAAYYAARAPRAAAIDSEAMPPPATRSAAVQSGPAAGGAAPSGGGSEPGAPITGGGQGPGGGGAGNNASTGSPASAAASAASGAR